jgi:peptidoglycan/xylan/chitin deacetylase (PgdA/CDA1 family)
MATAVVTIHDACPAFSTKIFKFTNELERLDIKYNIALIPFFNEKQDLPSFPEFVDKIKSCTRCEIVLHGLYHENRNGHFDDFHNVRKAAAEEEIRAGLEIFQEIGIKTNVFIPPAWKLNDSSIKVLEKLGFSLVEMQEEFLLLSHKPFKKIKVPKVLNWDSTGHPEKNIPNIVRDRRRFKLLDQQKTEMIRIAMHPRDPHEALKDQIDMIRELKDQGYTIPLYKDLIPKLEDSSISLSASL